MRQRVAVVVPCYDEEVAIGTVIADFRSALPDARICVFDNNSRDDTVKVAVAAGAEVHRVPMQGKGHVVRRIFADIDADAYVMVDGDDTYDAGGAQKMLDMLFGERLDMVVGVRQPIHSEVHRRGHAFGNAMLSGFLSRLFGCTCSDILSGYRVFSRRFAKSFPVLSSGFEIETELTVHALELKLPVAEVPIAFKERPPGSSSKLSTFRDGFRILGTMLRLFSAERPLLFYGLWALALALVAIIIAIPVLQLTQRRGSCRAFRRRYWPQASSRWQP